MFPCCRDMEQVQESMKQLKAMYLGIMGVAADEAAPDLPEDLTAEKMVEAVKAYFASLLSATRTVLESMRAQVGRGKWEHLEGVGFLLILSDSYILGLRLDFLLLSWWLLWITRDEFWFRAVQNAFHTLELPKTLRMLWASVPSSPGRFSFWARISLIVSSHM